MTKDMTFAGIPIEPPCVEFTVCHWKKDEARRQAHILKEYLQCASILMEQEEKEREEKLEKERKEWMEKEGISPEEDQPKVPEDADPKIPEEEAEEAEKMMQERLAKYQAIAKERQAVAMALDCAAQLEEKEEKEKAATGAIASSSSSSGPARQI